MINTVAAYDDYDEELGEYFNLSFEYIEEVIQGLEYVKFYSLDGESCTSNNIDLTIRPINQQPYIFTAFSHGSYDGACLLTTAEDYVNNVNSHLFCNSLFYSNACCIGSDLGSNLISDKSCTAFIGYKDVSKAPYNEALNDLFVECELFALKEFLTTTKSIEQVFKEMLSFIDEKIQFLYDNDEIIDASFLEINRDCIICLGNDKSLTRLDFMT